MEEVVHALHEWVAAAGPWLVPLVGLVCLLKYLLPPFPSDSMVLAGAALAAGGRASPGLLFAACMAGSWIGMAADYRFGRWLEGRLRHPGDSRWHRWFGPERLTRLESGYRRFGPWILVFNRLLPVARALLFVFAGMSRMGLGRTLLLGTVSTAAWEGGLVWAATRTGPHMDELAALADRFAQRLGLAGAILVAAGLVVWRVGRRRTARTDSAPAGGDTTP